MILFAKDFDEQGAIVDTSTKNTSFIKMALILNKLNVRNNKFHLSLYDRELIGINPHDLRDDSLELKQRIALEAKRNFWYYIREVVRISASGSGGIPYILNRSNLAQAWIFLNSINGFQVMPRQIGKTIGAMSLASWYLYIAGFNVKWGEFTKGYQLQTENVDRLKKIRDALPKWMLYPTANDTNNKEGVSYDYLKTEFLTFVAQTDKQAAGDQARGQSLAVIHIDEAAYYTNIDKSYNSATAVMDTAADQAKSAGLPAAILLTTTAGDIDDPRGKWCYRTVCDAMRFTEQLYDSHNLEELMNTIRMNSRNNYVYMEYSYKQLGKSEEWFETVTRNKDPKIIERDYLNVWTHGTDGSIFSKEIIDKVQSSRRDPVAVTSYESLVTNWYDDPKILLGDNVMRNRPYVIGCDTSDNVGRDFTTLCMVDPYDLHIVCTFKCNTCNLLIVAKYIVKMLSDFPRSIFIPERNKNGAFLLDYIFAEMKRDQFNPLTRIFNKYFQEYDQDTDVRNLNYDSGTVRKMFGFSTTKSSTSRELLYSSVLMTALKLVGDRLYDASIINEISGLTTKNGRVDHSEIGHDDLLIAFLLACYFIIFGSNHQLYGIGIDEFMCNVKNDGEFVDADVKRQTLLMQNQLVEYKKRLKACKNNPIAASAYEREIQKLIAMVGDVDESDDFKPLDQVNRSASEQAKKSSGMNLSSWLSVI